MTAGEPGHPGHPGQPGHADGMGGTGGEGGQGGKGGTALTRTARYSVLFLFAISLLLAGGNYVLSANAVNKAVQSRASTVQLCRLGNDARAQQIQLWTRLVALSTPPPHETPAHRARRQRTIRVFLAYVHRLFAPRNCEKVGNTP